MHCGTLSAEEVTLTLDEAISIALRDNRDVLLKAEDVRKAKLKIAEAQAGLFPTLNFTGSWTDTRGYYSTNSSQTITQTTLKQYLYKGGETVNTIEQNKYKLKVSQALLDKTKLKTILTVKKAFYTLLLAAEFANLNKGILDNTREHLDSIKTRYKNGLISESDVLKIESSLSSVIEVYETSLGQVEAGSILLNNLLYLRTSG
jgi:outer membrane protein TolC